MARKEYEHGKQETKFAKTPNVPNTDLRYRIEYHYYFFPTIYIFIILFYTVHMAGVRVLSWLWSSIMQNSRSEEIPISAD